MLFRLKAKNHRLLSSQIVIILVQYVHSRIHYRYYWLTLRIIFATVLRELDGLKKRHDLGLSARVALRWIEDCMEKKPFWMHVQRSTEVLPVRRTQDRGFMALTNDDQILECALLFESEVMDGRVVLLTRDTALKIKAMAEVFSQLSSCNHLVNVGLSPFYRFINWVTENRGLRHFLRPGHDGRWCNRILWKLAESLLRAVPMAWQHSLPSSRHRSHNITEHSAIHRLCWKLCSTFRFSFLNGEFGNENEDSIAPKSEGSW